MPNSYRYRTGQKSHLKKLKKHETRSDIASTQGLQVK